MAYGGNFWDSVLFPPWDPEIKLPSSVLGDVLKSLLPTVCLSGPEGVCLFVCLFYKSTHNSMCILLFHIKRKRCSAEESVVERASAEPDEIEGQLFFSV